MHRHLEKFDVFTSNHKRYCKFNNFKKVNIGIIKNIGKFHNYQNINKLQLAFLT